LTVDGPGNVRDLVNTLRRRSLEEAASLKGIVTLPREERERTMRGTDFQAAADDLAPRAHRRGAEHAV
jgi:hypothetical protein